MRFLESGVIGVPWVLSPEGPKPEPVVLAQTNFLWAKCLHWVLGNKPIF